MTKHLHGQPFLRLNLNDFSRPLLDESKNRAETLKLHIPTATHICAVALPKGSSTRWIRTNPSRNAKRLVAFKSKLIPILQPTLPFEIESFGDRPINHWDLSLRSSSNRHPCLAHPLTINIQRKAHRCHLRQGILCIRYFFFPSRLLFRKGAVEIFHRLLGGSDLAIQTRQFLFLIRKRHLQKGLRIPIPNPILSIFRNVVKKGVYLIKVPLGDRIVFVIVTLRTRNRQTEPCRPRGAHAINHIKIKVFRLNNPPFIARHDVPMKPARNLLLNGRLRQEIPSDLLDSKLTKRHVRIEGVDHPFPPQPHVPKGIVVVTTGIPVAGEV